MFEAIKKFLGKTTDGLKDGLKVEPDDNQQRLYRYWMNSIKRAKKAQLTDDWKVAENRYAAQPQNDSEDGRPYVNDYRKLHEAEMSFLDQQEPAFRIMPSEAFASDEFAVKKAECDSAYIKKVWREQKCQKAQSRKLNNALLINNGDTLVEFDLKKWMPSVRFLPARDVLIDPDCGGIVENAQWMGYFEDVPLEEFKSWHPDMSKEVFEIITKKSGSYLNDEERQFLNDGDEIMFKSVKVYHIFARNTAAIREQTDTGELKPPDKPLAEELQLETPRRYMQYVEGYSSPIVDRDTWPFDLDHEEFPLTHLQFNQCHGAEGNLYGFPDYKQMERLDQLSDDMLRDLGIASFWAAVAKFVGASNQKIDPVELDDFLNNPRTSFLADMLDTTTGLPKMKVLERGRIDPAQIQMYNLVHDQSKEASALSELLEFADAQAYKDVTAIAVRQIEANLHQRINRRLVKYEQSICEDATKMLEVAHQRVPPLSRVAIMQDLPAADELGHLILDELGNPVTKETEVVVKRPWDETLRLLAQGGTLIELGVDAIVGPELAQYWSYKQPAEQWRLNVKVTVEPGSTRSITNDQQAATLKQLYNECFSPFYEAIMRPDLAREFLEMIGKKASVPNIDNLLPTLDELKAFIQQQQIIAQQEAMNEQAGQGEQGGQPLSSPAATGGELQE